MFWGRDVFLRERGDVQETMLNARVCNGFCFSRAVRFMKRKSVSRGFLGRKMRRRSETRRVFSRIRAQFWGRFRRFFGRCLRISRCVFECKFWPAILERFWTKNRESRPWFTKNDQKRPTNDQKNTKIDQKDTKKRAQMTKIQIKNDKN